MLERFYVCALVSVLIKCTVQRWEKKPGLFISVESDKRVRFPMGSLEFPTDIIFRLRYGAGFDSASNINEY